MNKEKWIELAVEITEWHLNCFPDATLDGQLLKLEEELREWKEAVTVEDSGKELADVFIVCCGLSRWHSITGRIISLGLLNDITHYNDVFYKQVYNKHQKNKIRVWQKLLKAVIIMSIHRMQRERIKNGRDCYLHRYFLVFHRLSSSCQSLHNYPRFYSLDSCTIRDFTNLWTCFWVVVKCLLTLLTL